MTREDIIRMAREAGIYHTYATNGRWDGLTNIHLGAKHDDLGYSENRIVEILSRFAELVAEAKREECAKICEEIREIAQEEARKQMEQSITDPENQPSQYGTVPLEVFEDAIWVLDKLWYKYSGPEVTQKWAKLLSKYGETATQ